MKFLILVLAVIVRAQTSVSTRLNGPPYYKCVEFTEDYCAKLVETDDPPVEPEWFDAKTETHFYLYTRRTPKHQEILLNDLGSLRDSFFDDNKETVLIIHGYTNDYTSPVNRKLTKAYLITRDVNVIVVDWGAGCRKWTPYNFAARRTAEVGEIVAEFLHFIHNFMLNSKITIVGHSLGAHAAGFAGKSVATRYDMKIATIVGLDPAGPLFTNREPYERLNAGDASYVEAIHTNWRMFGFAKPLADKDFYPNTGYVQPNCGALCDVNSHSRAIDLFEESLFNNKFDAKRCPKDFDIRLNNGKDMISKCLESDHVKLGDLSTWRDSDTRGVYYLATNSKPNYGMGPFNYRETCKCNQ